jgi:hypothetical protein
MWGAKPTAGPASPSRRQQPRQQQQQHQDDVQNTASEAWLRALKEATASLRQVDPAPHELEATLHFLLELESVLVAKKKQWNLPPKQPPPPFSSSLANRTPPTSIPAVTSWRDMNNPYAGFQDDDSESDLDDDDGGDLNGTTDDEAGDRPVPPTAPYVVVYPMDLRRLLIRVLSAQSDVYAAMALWHRKRQNPPQWLLGAEQYTACLEKIHEALILADSAISRFIASLNNDSGSTTKAATAQLLMEDANIVEVAVQSMTQNREHYIAAARQQEAYLVRKLNPQWETRDAAKARIGADRWKNNPAPKFDHARMREAREAQLRDVQQAVQCLERLDMSSAEASTRLLKERLLQAQPLGQQQRYNLERPRDYSRRVDWTLYPDPSEFVWIFTGSSGVTEFFELDGVKLDWYYTTGTVKTSMNHPKQGKTQLFGGRVDPDTYKAILRNPRQHTGVRYHQKNKNKK